MNITALVIRSQIETLIEAREGFNLTEDPRGDIITLQVWGKDGRIVLTAIVTDSGRVTVKGREKNPTTTSDMDQAFTAIRKELNIL